MPIIQENPSYFSDRVQAMDENQVLYKKYHNYQDPNVGNSAKRRGHLSTEDTDVNELEVFLSSCESNHSSFTDSGVQRDFKETSFGRHSSDPNCGQSTDQKKGLGQKIGQFFWKSKSKHSLGSESHVSESTIESSGRGSPRFTPDSSLSICTSSLEEAGSSHSSNSNQISPQDESLLKTNNTDGNVCFMDDQTAHYRFDDCERYAANMYYNMMGMSDASPYTVAVQQSRARNNSVPITNDAIRVGIADMNEIQDCVQPYYNNTTFSTFPNPRRRSISYSSSSSTNGTAKRDKDKHQRVIDIQQDRDGYLRPNEPCNSRNVKNPYYMNDQPYTSSSKVQVHVDVHSPTPTSTSSLNSTEFEALNLDRNIRYHRRDLETSGTTDDSQSTVIAGSASSISYVPYYQNRSGSPTSPKHSQSSQSHRRPSNESSNNKDKISNGNNRILPVHLRRILSGNDYCEPYCTLCAMIASTPKQTRMDVAIVSCQECFFSKNAETHIRGFFDKLQNTTDKQKMDVVLQSYDLKELEHSKVIQDIHGSKVQIVLISHHFLQRLKLEASTRVRLSPVNRVFRSKRVIAVLVGVHRQEISDGYESVLARFGEWFSVELSSTSKLDPEFCKKFSEQVVRIYNLELCSRSNFSVFPKKVTRDQPKIVVILKKPIEKDDEIRVDFACGHKVEAPTFMKLENPSTLSVRVPDTLCPDKTALVGVTVYVNSHKLGATCIKTDFQQGDEDVVEKITKMVPGFLKLFDDHIKQTLSKNYRECTDFLSDSSIELMNDCLTCKGDEFPTVMHFAAYYGLEHTIYTVMDEADGLEQCKMVNDRELTPADIAAQRGFDNIVRIINDYQDITESYKALQYIQDIYGRKSVLALSDLKVVTRMKNSNDPSNYDNLPETAIIEKHDPSEELECNQSGTGSEGQSSASDGSYITWNLKDDDEQCPMGQELIQIVKKPTPTARSPVRKREYINVDGQPCNPNPSPPASTPQNSPAEIWEADQEQVQLRGRRKNSYHRDPVRRASISPNYQIPRGIDQDYLIPPKDARPVRPEKPQPQPRPRNNSPVLVKKGPGSIPTTEGGYLIMNINEEAMQNLTYANGDFVEITKTDIDALVNNGSDPSSPILTPGPSTDGPRFSTPGAVGGPARKISENNNEPNIVLDSADEELIQLMKDFPTSGYTLQQMELLFENWKTRPDVERSIEEKNNYMKKLREDYKKIQQGIQKEKKASPIEFIKDLIKRRKKSSTITSPKIDLDRSNPFPLSHEDLRRIQSRASDRESFGSHGSGNSVHDSGVSDPDSEKERDKMPNDITETRSNSKPVYSNPLDKRFCPSYVGPDNLKPVNEIKPSHFQTDDDFSYQTPPPPRPVTILDQPSPPIPPKPSKSVNTTPESQPQVDPPNKPPVIPQKPSHMRADQEDTSENAPPPPPRTYMKPNPFNYIDYSQRTKDAANRSVTRPPYDNVKDVK